MPRIPLEFSQYDETRFTADVQRRLNVYNHSKRGLRQLPGVIEYSDFIAPAYVQSSALTANSIHFIPEGDGLKLYYIITTGSVSSAVLTTAWDVTTRTTVVTSPTITTTGVSGLHVNRSQEKVFVCSGTGASTQINSGTMSTPGDLSTLSVDAATYTIGVSIWDLYLNAAGTKLYVLTQTNTVRQYALTVAWDVSTATLSYTLDIGALGADTAIGMRMNNDGRKLFIADAGLTDAVLEFTLFAPDVLAGALLRTSYSYAAQTIFASKITFGDNGEKMYIFDTTNKIIYQYTIPAYMLTDASGVSGESRGAIVMDDILYAVIGAALFEITDGGGPISRGPVVNDGEPVGMSTDGTNLVITAGDYKYNYTVLGGLVQITDPDLQTAYTSAYLDRRFYFEQPDGYFVASEIDAPTSIDALDFARAESYNDLLLAIFGHNQLLYMCGQKSIEVWYSSGTGRPPVERQQVLERGIAGKRAIGSNDNTIYFLDNNRRPNRMMVLAYEPIYTPALGDEFDSYDIVSDCIVNCYTWEQEKFAEFTFPDADVTWTYHENSGQWTKRESPAGGRFRASHYVTAYNKLLCFDHATGKIYEFSDSNYQDDGTNFTRTIDTKVIIGDDYDAHCSELIASAINLTISATAASSISVSFCTDPDAPTPTFSAARSYTLTAGVNHVRIHRWGKFSEGVFRITTSANDKIEFISASVDAELLNG